MESDEYINYKQSTNKKSGTKTVAEKLVFPVCTRVTWPSSLGQLMNHYCSEWVRTLPLHELDIFLIILLADNVCVEFRGEKDLFGNIPTVYTSNSNDKVQLCPYPY